jgi:opacity protein-like surface antigen
MRKLMVVAFLAVLLATVAMAQVPKGNVFFGYSYVRSQVFSINNPFGVGSNDHANLNGWNGSLEGKFLPWIGIVADLSGHYGSQDFQFICPIQPQCPSISVDSKVYSFLFGPRISVSVGKLRPFAHALFGASHINASASGFSDTDTAFASTYGGGLDYHIVPLLSWRFQADLLQTRFFDDTQNNFRLSTGIVLNF